MRVIDAMRHALADGLEARIELTRSEDPSRWWKSKTLHGFRLAPQDLWIIGIGLAIAGAAGFSAHPIAPLVAWYAPVVVLHFFLFCNVFRIGTLCEVLWVALFAGNFLGVSWWLMEVPQAWSLLVQLPVTAAVVALSVAIGAYSGILCERHKALARFERIVRRLRG